MKDFIVALTADFYDNKGSQKYRDIGLSALSQSPRLKHHVFKEHQQEIAPEQITGALGGVSWNNVLLAPHCIAWTDELLRDIGRAACQVMVDLAQGQQPQGILNPEVFESVRFNEKWRRFHG